MAQRIFKKDVHSEVASNLIQSTLIDAIKQKELAVIGTPKVEPTELNPDSAYSYHVTVELKPKLSPITPKGMRIRATRSPLGRTRVSPMVPTGSS